MILTWRTAALSGVLVIVVFVLATWWALVGAIAIVAGIVAADVLFAAKPSDMLARRGGDTSLRLGRQGTVWLRISNGGKRRFRGRIRDSWNPSAGASGGLSRHTIAPGQRRLHHTTLTPTRRGDRQAGPVVLRGLGPLGFAGRQGALSAPWAVRVLPPFTSSKHLPSRIKRLRELDGRSAILQRGAGTEFDSLREYVPGDDVRGIDWRSTARTNTVVVKTWRPERDRHVLIVIDSGRLSAGRISDETRLDYAMDAALLLAALASKAGDRVDLIIVDRTLRASVQRSSQAELIADLVNAMAPIEPLLAESNFTLIAQEVLQRVSRRSLVVFMTGLDDVAMSEGLIPVLAPILRRHKVVLASVSDPETEKLAAGKETALDVYQAAAAELDRSRRTATSRLLTRLGMSVVQAPPNSFAPRVADHYLELKKAGQL